MGTDDPGFAEDAPMAPPTPVTGVYRSAATAVVITWSLRLIGLVSVVVLARVLTPRDFGIVALAMSVLALVDIFSALGLRQALLRIAAPVRAHYDTAWTLQFLVLVLLAAVLVVLGPLAAQFYGEPALGILIAVMASCFVIDGLANIGVVDFERNFDFGRDLRMRLTVRLTSFAVTLAAALILQNYWALVIGMVAQSGLNAAASYVFHPFRPRFSLAMRKDLLGVSLWMFLAYASQTVQNQIEKVVVGRISTRNVLGLYAVSRDFSLLFTDEVATALNRVAFVTTAQADRPLSADPERLCSMLGAYGLIAAPLGFGLAATAGEALPLLLGSQWTEAVPLLSIIAPGCAIYAVSKLIVVILQASGDARLGALISIAGAITLVGMTAGLAFAGHDAIGVAFGALGATTLLLAAGIVVLARKAETGAASLLSSVGRPFAAALVMMVAVGGLDTEMFDPLTALAIKIPVGAATFAIAAGVLWVLQGRPEGAEKTVLFLARQGTRRLRRRSAAHR